MARFSKPQTSKWIFKILFIFCLAVVNTGNAFADQASHLQAAKEFLETTNFRNLLIQISKVFSKHEADRYAKEKPEMDPVKHLVEEFHMKYAIRFYDKNLERIESETAILYTKYYTEEELKVLNEFYQSPLGKKTLVTAPKIMSDMSAVTQKILAEMPPIDPVEKKAFEKSLQDALAKIDPKKKSAGCKDCN